jgi:hypothetical protein
MDGLVEELLRLEREKHNALIRIDASAYDASVHEQLRLIDGLQKQLAAAGNIERLLTLSQLLTLNSRLLQNLLATTPLFGAGYTPAGRATPAETPARVSVEA